MYYYRGLSVMNAGLSSLLDLSSSPRSYRWAGCPRQITGRWLQRVCAKLRVVVEYDREADAAYIRLGEGRVAETMEVEPGVLLDLDDEGRVIGVEVLEASVRLGRVLSRLEELTVKARTDYQV
ncbi:protein of unknown function DUF2283 [Pyrolobus fumarii 1A]|uniref:DUF2283 domain-containing protein n=1 Tax=Pyrolobus fumarii (strain DSM 11204 / 1A) TaxID=694429 RepID=G0EFM1_PYRF1|nr:protein of unknown function DUF2283 [Pyrolobus fumarii 1A]